MATFELNTQAYDAPEGKPKHRDLVHVVISRYKALSLIQELATALQGSDEEVVLSLLGNLSPEDDD